MSDRIPPVDVEIGHVEPADEGNTPIYDDGLLVMAVRQARMLLDQTVNARVGGAQAPEPEPGGERARAEEERAVPEQDAQIDLIRHSR